LPVSGEANERRELLAEPKGVYLMHEQEVILWQDEEEKQELCIEEHVDVLLDKQD